MTQLQLQYELDNKQDQRKIEAAGSNQEASSSMLKHKCNSMGAERKQYDQGCRPQKKQPNNHQVFKIVIGQGLRQVQPQSKQ